MNHPTRLPRLPRFPLFAMLVATLLALALPRAAQAAPKKSPPPKASTAASVAPPPAPAGSGQQDDDTDPDDVTPLPFKDGPQQIILGHNITMALPEHRRFLGLPEAADVMKKMGNLYNDDLLGIVVSDDDADWLVTLRYDEEGYIKDDDKLDADELLKDIRSGEDEYNEERKKAGFPPIHAEGWFEQPAYDKTAHQLMWALKVVATDGSSINLSTRILGRKGYVAVTLLADPEKVGGYRGDAKALVTATTFDSGSRYGDFDGKTDKVAEYGLAGLIVAGVGVGVAKAAKIGLLAAFWKPILAFILAAKKAVIALFIGIGAFFKKLFGGKRAAKESAPPTT